jgi:hypothetical protein
MRKVGILSIALASAALFAAALGLGAPGDDLPAPIATRQTIFSIPFTLPRAGSPDQEPAEVRLFVSSDYGTSWAIAARVEPTQTSFTYRAPHDGEYWFAIRTVDKLGHVKPDAVQLPEVRVIVDTLPPRLEIQAARNPAGEIIVHWLAVDPILKADTLRIDYQVAGDSAWRPIQFQPPRDDPNRGSATGEIAVLPIAQGKANVRAQISDRAGNIAVAEAAVADRLPLADGPALGSPAAGSPERNAPGSGSPGFGSPAFPPPNGDNPRMIRGLTPSGSEPPRQDDRERHDLTAGRNPPFVAANPARVDSSNGYSGSPGAAAGSNDWPTDHLSYQPVGHGPDNTSTRQGPPDGRSIYTQASTPVMGGGVEGRASPPVTDRVVAPPGPSLVPNSSPAPDSFAAPRVTPTAMPLTPAVSPFTQWLPPGERPYMVNSKRFALEYEIESAPAGGIAKVEVWGTRDGGRTWTSYGVEPSRQGPVRVSVDAEGLYGFRITVQDARGSGNSPPKNGDLPELWVGVDLTKPAARITAIDPGTGDHASELAIRWEASDAMLAARPITLSFSDRPDGPWTPIAGGLENTGGYVWRFDNRVPDNIFIRLEARDEAGNVGEFQTTTPISLAAARPQGHLRNVHPMNDDSAGAQSYHFYR